MPSWVAKSSRPWPATCGNSLRQMRAKEPRASLRAPGGLLESEHKRCFPPITGVGGGTRRHEFRHPAFPEELKAGEFHSPVMCR